MTTLVLAHSGPYQYTGKSPGEAFAAVNPGNNLYQLAIDQVSGISLASVTRWFQLYNSVPIVTSTPLISIAVPAGANFSWTPVPQWAFGWASSTQNFWCVSDTPDTYTQSVDEFWVQCQGYAEVRT